MNKSAQYGPRLQQGSGPVLCALNFNLKQISILQDILDILSVWTEQL